MTRKNSRFIAGLAGLIAVLLTLGTGMPHVHAAPSVETHHHDCDHAPEAPDSAPASDPGCSHCMFLNAMASAATPDAPIVVPCQDICKSTLPETVFLSGRLVHLSVSARAPPSLCGLNPLSPTV